MGHIKKIFGLSALVSLLVFFLLKQVLACEPIFFAFGFERVSYHAAIVLLIMGSEPIFYFLSSLFNFLSRRYEFQADRFAVLLMNSSKDLYEALLVLAKDNLSNLTPHPAYSFFHYSHPALMERLNRINSAECNG
jgi:STE24 endopeptidase